MTLSEQEDEYRDHFIGGTEPSFWKRKISSRQTEVNTCRNRAVAIVSQRDRWETLWNDWLHLRETSSGFRLWFTTHALIE